MTVRTVTLSTTVDLKLYELMRNGSYAQVEYDLVKEFCQPEQFNTFGIVHGLQQPPATCLDIVCIDMIELSIHYMNVIRPLMRNFVLVFDTNDAPRKANWKNYHKMGAVGLVGYVNPPLGFVDLKQGLYQLVIQNVPAIAPAGVTL